MTNVLIVEDDPMARTLFEIYLKNSGRYRMVAAIESASMAEPVIAFGHTTVITAIRPVLSAISGDDWAPFWTLETADEYADGWRAP